MNTIEHVVTGVLGEPYQVDPLHALVAPQGVTLFVSVLANSYGRISPDGREDIMMFDSEQAAKGVVVGYRYDA